jgi:uncharacterized protein (TIGR00255 family)
MIQSMTGFGRAEAAAGGRKLTAEVKSLNHRNLELMVRLPAPLSLMEGEIRKQVGAVVSRGRVEVSLQLETEPGTGTAGVLRANLPLIERYMVEVEKIREALRLEDRPTLGMILGVKDVMIYEEPSLREEELQSATMEALGKALEALVAMRKKEGEALYQDLLGRIRSVLKWVEEIRGRVPLVQEEFQRRFTDRVRELMGEMPLDMTRISQEIAILTEKSDVTEELVRLESHGVQFLEMLEDRDPVGRKLDFLLQEMHREINTIGSKSGDVEIARAVIEIKGELAKLREQAQNVE